MSVPASEAWALNVLGSPATRVASILVERLDLWPPVDVEGMTNQVADLEAEYWPYPGCDAVVVDLGSKRPRVILRGDLPHRRRRFTLAHELGHVHLAWHVGRLGCQPDPSRLAADPSAPPAADLAEGGVPSGFAYQEMEATLFASHLLIPERFLRPLLGSSEMEAVLGGLDRADVSASAALVRLKGVLQPGFCFRLREGLSDRLFLSHGTSLPARMAGFDRQLMRNLSEDFGESVVGGRPVEWFRLASFDEFVPAEDSRTATEILRSLVISAESDEQRQAWLHQSINGVVGGMLSTDRAKSRTQALAILQQRFRVKLEYGDLVADPDFDVYLRKKVEGWAERQGISG